MTDTNKVEPVAYHYCYTNAFGHPVWNVGFHIPSEATEWHDLVPASALAALQAQLAREIENSEGLERTARAAELHCKDLMEQLAEAQAETQRRDQCLDTYDKAFDVLSDQRIKDQAASARYRNALVGMMACTLRADCPPDVYDAAEKALKGDV